MRVKVVKYTTVNMITAFHKRYGKLFMIIGGSRGTSERDNNTHRETVMTMYHNESL